MDTPLISTQHFKNSIVDTLKFQLMKGDTADEVVSVLINMALQGNLQAIKTIFQYIDGNPAPLQSLTINNNKFNISDVLDQLDKNKKIISGS